MVVTRARAKKLLLASGEVHTQAPSINKPETIKEETAVDAEEESMLYSGTSYNDDADTQESSDLELQKKKPSVHARREPILRRSKRKRDSDSDGDGDSVASAGVLVSLPKSVKFLKNDACPGRAAEHEVSSFDTGNGGSQAIIGSPYRGSLDASGRDKDSRNR